MCKTWDEFDCNWTWSNILHLFQMLMFVLIFLSTGLKTVLVLDQRGWGAERNKRRPHLSRIDPWRNQSSHEWTRKIIDPTWRFEGFSVQVSLFTDASAFQHMTSYAIYHTSSKMKFTSSESIILIRIDRRLFKNQQENNRFVCRQRGALWETARIVDVTMTSMRNVPARFSYFSNLV